MSIEQDLAYFTECQLATVEGFKHLKRPPVGEVRRHTNIATQMVHSCITHEVEPVGPDGRGLGRLEEAIKKAKE